MPRYLGQHFLVNKKKIFKIVEALELKDADTVIEIGPGHGELTKELRIKNAECRIIAIERDKQLAQDLRDKIYDLRIKNFEIVEGDVLRILKSLIVNLKSYKVTGNIPYYITGYLLRILGELENKPSLIVLLIQKEVAERICAKTDANQRISRTQRNKCSGKMNILAASVQFWAEPKIIGYVSKKDFRPMPKVDSAIIKLKTDAHQRISRTQRMRYYEFIKILFKQPRKTILNNLRPMTNNLRLLKEKLESIGVNPGERPQDLSIEEIMRLSTLF